MTASEAGFSACSLLTSKLIQQYTVSTNHSLCYACIIFWLRKTCHSFPSAYPIILKTLPWLPRSPIMRPIPLSQQSLRNSCYTYRQRGLQSGNSPMAAVRPLLPPGGNILLWFFHLHSTRSRRNSGPISPPSSFTPLSQTDLSFCFQSLFSLCSSSGLLVRTLRK